MAWGEIPAGSVDAKSPIDETLMEQIKNNDDDHESRILALEAGGGGAGASIQSFTDRPEVGKILDGFEDNTAEFKWWKFASTSGLAGANPERLGSFDWEGIQPNINPPHKYAFDTASTGGSSSGADSFDGLHSQVAKNQKRYFRLKKGLNFFSISTHWASSHCDSFTVKVDNQTLTVAGIKDEHGDVYSGDTLSTNSATPYYQKQYFFFGGTLSADKDQLIEFENTDSASKHFYWDAFTVGVVTEPSRAAVSHKDINVAPGKALIRGTEVEINGATHEFQESTGYGRIDILAENTAGNMATKIVKGAEGAFTVVKQESTVDYSSSTLDVTNCTYFPSKGVCLAQFPKLGETKIFSYTGKSTSAIHQHQLTGVKWEGDYFPNYTPDGFRSDTGIATMDADVSIVLLADDSTGVHIQAGVNDKIDWTLSEDGAAPSSHTATLDPGFYTADLMSLGNHIQEKMHSVNPLADLNQYFCKWDSSTHEWRLGVKESPSIDTMEFDIATGPSTATNVMSQSMGFNNTDLTGSFVYRAQNQTEHNAARTFEEGDFRDAHHNTIKYERANQTNNSASRNDLDQRHGITSIRSDNNSYQMFRVFPDKDSCGAIVSVQTSRDSGSLMMCIDNGRWIWATQMNQIDQDITSPLRSNVVSYMLTWPLGTKEFTVRYLVYNAGREYNVANEMMMLGYRNLYPAPNYSALKVDEAAYKFYKVRPLRMFQEWYDHDYAVQSNAFEKITGITKTGSWVSQADGEAYNGTKAQSSTINDQIDVEFTISGSSGGFAFLDYTWVSDSPHVGYYLSDGSTPTIDNAHLMNRISHDLSQPGFQGLPNSMPGQVMGLPPGNYVASKKILTGGSAAVTGYVVFDTVESDPDGESLGDLNNNDRSISYPYWGVDKIAGSKDGWDGVPSYLERTPFGREQSAFYYKLNTDGNMFSQEDVGAVVTRRMVYKVQTTGSNSIANNEFGFFRFGEVIFGNDIAYTGHTGSVTPTVDGRAYPNYSQQVQAKGGTAMSASHWLSCPQFKKNFFKESGIAMTDSTTVTVADTRGIRVGQNVLVRNSGDLNDDSFRRVASITTDVSITLNKAVSGTFGNYDELHFGGLHNILWNCNNADELIFGGLCWLMMPVQEWTPKDISSKAGEVAEAVFRNVGTTTDLYPPVYKDGTVATWSECIPTVMKITASTDRWDFSQNAWLNPVASGTLDIKLTAIRGDR